MPQPRRILVVLPTWVGDSVMATPTLAALRRRFPDAHIAALGGSAALGTLAGQPGVDAFLADPGKSAGPRGPRGVLRAARLVRQGGYDLAILLSNAFRSAAVCRLGRVGHIVGYARDGRGWLLGERLEAPRDERGRFRPVPAIDYYLALAGAVGADTTDRTMHLAVEPPFAAEAETLFTQAGLGGDGPVVMINPGASFGSSKLYPPERFAAVADALIERRGARILINAGPAEREIAAAVEGAMTHPPAVNLGRRSNSLGLVKALLARCELLITGDTGPRHIGAALGTAVVTIFGSTDPDWTTLNYPRERIVRAEVDCSPCQKKVCPLPPGPRHHQCIRAIAPGQVISAAEELLALRPGGRP